MQTLIHNAVLVLPERLIDNGWLCIEEGRIASIGESATCPDPATIEQAIDAAGRYLLPGLIDLHCDGIEKLVEPRPNVFFDLPVALMEADSRLAACGITTEFHAITLDDQEFGVRSDGFILRLYEAIKQLGRLPENATTQTVNDQEASELLVRHKLHARLELTSQNGLETVTELIANKAVDMVSLMDHSPGQGQYTSVDAFRDYVMRMSNRSVAEVDAIIAHKQTQIAEIPQRIAFVARLAREAGLAIATHDDDTAEKVEQWPSFSISISEFPTTMVAAKRAHELGLAVCMGAPNALRGKSSGGNLNALEAIQAGITDMLCSDFYPAAMLAAVFKLATQQILALPLAMQLVTLNPAKAIGLGKEYGSLEVGKVADLILVALNRQSLPIVQRVFVSGLERLVHNRTLSL